MGSDGDWHRDVWTVRSLRLVLELGAADSGRPTPENHAELRAALMAVRERLRRRLLLAEGVDPRTGLPVA